ncbi:hypothetical protein DV515_00010820, partial [Chloebia gouldiae]
MRPCHRDSSADSHTQPPCPRVSDLEDSEALMQPLVMQEWLHVLPPCPEWHTPGQAQPSSPARPLAQ